MISFSTDCESVETNITLISGIAQSNKQYRELSDQRIQIQELYSNDADVIIADKTIFGFYRKRLRKSGLIEKERVVAIEMFPIFPPSHYVAAFQDKDMRDSFNLGIAELRKNGGVREIRELYLNVLGEY